MVRKITHSFKNAFQGFLYAYRTERNLRIEVFIAGLVFIGMFFFDMQLWERSILILLIFWVLVAELINTAIERVSDILKPRVHPYAKVIKDIMAAAVLISAFASIIIGSMLFSPHIKLLLEKWL